MQTAKKYSTNTLSVSDGLVPWLAAKGPLAYTPENPPGRDYYFQYGWVLPQVLASDEDLKRHRYFGAWAKDSATEIFAFWNDARAGRQVRVHVKYGRHGPNDVTVPIAVYLHRERAYRSRLCYMFVQHGSYQCVPREDQPEMADAIVYLYRGIENAKVFRYLSFDSVSLDETAGPAWRAFLKTQATLLSDSSVSFISMHEKVNRCETGGLNNSSFVNEDIASSSGLKFEDDGFARDLWRNHHQCFSLEREIAEQKFGPNLVILKTPLTNIRITTFFAGEAEAKVIDPTRVRIVDAVGCEYAQKGEPTAVAGSHST